MDIFKREDASMKKNAHLARGLLWLMAFSLAAGLMGCTLEEEGEEKQPAVFVTEEEKSSSTEKSLEKEETKTDEQEEKEPPEDKEQEDPLLRPSFFSKVAPGDTWKMC